MIHLPGVLRAAEEIQAFCQLRGWPFCFIGGVAVQRWAEPRLTQDVDLTLLTGFGCSLTNCSNPFLPAAAPLVNLH